VRKQEPSRPRGTRLACKNELKSIDLHHLSSHLSNERIKNAGAVRVS